MNREKQCPVCKLTFPYVGMEKHLAGTYCWGDSVPILNEETKAIWSYWKAKKNKQTTRLLNGSGVEFLLTATEIVQLFTDAGITPNDIGRANHQYGLARHNDTGNYEMGNCRFILAIENQREQKHPTERMRGATVLQYKKTHTPYGTYESMAEAVRETGICKATLAGRIRSTTEKMKEYYYA